MGVKFSPNPTLHEAQIFMREVCVAMNFRSKGPENVMLMAEELGEVAKEVRKLHWHKGDEAVTRTNLAHELVDVLNYVCALANDYDIDLEKAYQEKSEIILKRYDLA